MERCAYEADPAAGMSGYSLNSLDIWRRSNSGVLSPRWDPVHRLPLKSLKVKVTVEGGIAKTSCFYEFENDTGNSWKLGFLTDS